MTYAIKGGAVIKTDKAPKTLGKSSTLDIDFKYTPKKALVTTITVTAVVELDGKEYTFTKDVTLDVLNADSASMPPTTTSTWRATTRTAWATSAIWPPRTACVPCS